jgi:hypothetical protein
MKKASSRPPRILSSFQDQRILRSSDEMCSLKLHFTVGSPARQLVGYIELLAAKDPERFVFAKVPSIIGHCEKTYKGAETFSRATAYFVLDFLRKQHIISETQTRRRKVGYFMREQRGFYVAMHDTVCCRGTAEDVNKFQALIGGAPCLVHSETKVCQFVGQLKAPGTYDAPTAEQNRRQRMPDLKAALDFKSHINAPTVREHFMAQAKARKK